MAYSYNGMTYSNENEQDIVISNNVNRTYNHNFDQKRPDTKAHMLMSLSNTYLPVYLPTYLPMYLLIPTAYLPTCLSVMD